MERSTTKTDLPAYPFGRTRGFVLAGRNLFESIKDVAKEPQASSHYDALAHIGDQQVFPLQNQWLEPKVTIMILDS